MDLSTVAESHCIHTTETICMDHILPEVHIWLEILNLRYYHKDSHCHRKSSDFLRIHGLTIPFLNMEPGIYPQNL